MYFTMLLAEEAPGRRRFCLGRGGGGKKPRRNLKRSCGWRGGERGNNDPTQRLLGKNQNLLIINHTKKTTKFYELLIIQKSTICSPFF